MLAHPLDLVFGVFVGILVVLDDAVQILINHLAVELVTVHGPKMALVAIVLNGVVVSLLESHFSEVVVAHWHL